MEVVAHYRVAVEVDGKVLGKKVKTFDDSLFAMAVVQTSQRIDSAQKGTLHAPRYEVVEERDVRIDQHFAWRCHGCSVLPTEKQLIVNFRQKIV